MFCTGKEQLTCNSEKMGCEGCYFNDDKNKDEIRVGEYVRSKFGSIGKVTRIEEGTFLYDGKELISFIGNVVKHSSNIVDLIEKGDIVHTEDVLSEDYYYMYDDEMIEATKRTIEDGVTLVDILTHEQYKENCYRVKE